MACTGDWFASRSGELKGKKAVGGSTCLQWQPETQKADGPHAHSLKRLRVVAFVRRSDTALHPIQHVAAVWGAVSISIAEFLTFMGTFLFSYGEMVNAVMNVLCSYCPSTVL